MGLGPVLAWFVVLSASLQGCAWSTVGVPIIGAFIPPAVSTADALEHARALLAASSIDSLQVQLSSNRTVHSEHGLGEDHARRAPDGRVYVVTASGRLRSPHPNRWDPPDGYYDRAVILIDSDTGGVRGTKFEGRSPEVPDAKRGSP